MRVPRDTVVSSMSTVAYLVLENPSNKNNLGTLIRCAAAFATEEVVVVGARKWSTHGAHGSNKVPKLKHYVELYCSTGDVFAEELSSTCLKGRQLALDLREGLIIWRRPESSKHFKVGAVVGICGVQSTTPWKYAILWKLWRGYLYYTVVVAAACIAENGNGKSDISK